MLNNLSFFFSVFRTVTVRQSAITFISTIINGLLGALFYIILARNLGPSQFGVLMVSILSLTLIADIASLGTGGALIRFVASDLSGNKERAFKFLKLGLEIRIITSILVVILGVILTPPIARQFFQKEDLIIPLRLAMLGVGGALLFSFIAAVLQSFQKFLVLGVVNILVNLLRVSIIVALLALQQLSLISSLSVYILLPFFGFFLALFFLPTRSFLGVSKEWELRSQFLNFSKWMAVSSIFAAIATRTDTFLSAKLLTSREVGIYSAASQLVVIIPQIVSSLGVVVSPKFAQFEDKEQMLTYLKKLQLMVVSMAGLGLLGIPLSYYFIPLIYGSDYVSSIPIFIILLIAMLIFLISVPIHTSILYFFGKPKFFTWLSLGQLFITVGVGYFMILNFGITGAAISVFFSMLFGLLVPGFWILRKIKTTRS